MKKLICTLLALMLMLSACSSGAESGKADGSQGAQQTLDAVEVDPTDTALHTQEQDGQSGQMAFGTTGAAKIPYTQNLSAVRYVTAYEDLPDYGALKLAVDKEFFEDHALLVVIDTVSSGSTEVSIASIEDGVVTLARTMSGDVGTTDMASWILWAEVERGLEYTWSIANPGVKSNLSAY